MKRSRRFTNDVIEDHGDWLLLDISTPKFKDATMAIDTNSYKELKCGRIFASQNGKNKSRCISAESKVGGKRISVHRLLLDGSEIDHINGSTMTFVDNRMRNLRVVTSSQNKRNIGLRSNNTSGATGVAWDTSKNRWIARVKINGKFIYLGSFKDKSMAVMARVTGEKKYYGEYAFVGR